MIENENFDQFNISILKKSYPNLYLPGEGSYYQSLFLPDRYPKSYRKRNN